MTSGSETKVSLWDLCSVFNLLPKSCGFYAAMTGDESTPVAQRSAVVCRDRSGSGLEPLRHEISATVEKGQSGYRLDTSINGIGGADGLSSKFVMASTTNDLIRNVSAESYAHQAATTPEFA